MLDGYLELTNGGEAEIVEKKSRFIGQILPVYSEEEAISFVESIKKKHYAARHNCYAFSVGSDLPLLRFSDDGEPQGTAGKPILEVINGSGIHNICIVVTRYFGGTLLGTGGLVRAYTDAAKAALESCEIKQMRLLNPIEIETDYTDIGKLQYILASQQIDITDTVYTDVVLIRANVPAKQCEQLVTLITDATGARANITVGDQIFG